MPDSDRRSTDNPEFSVIIPTFNRAHVLPRAIDSVLRQSHGDFELLVVDDGSVDGTAQCVASYQDARIRYIRHEQNRGQNTALNTGIGAARGTFVSFLDSDDEWDPEMLDAVRTRFSSDTELGLVYTAYRFRVADGELRGPLGGTVEGWVYAEALEQGHVSPPTAFSVRRTCFDTVGMFDRDNLYCNDDVMCLRLARAFKVGRVAEVLATKHEDGGTPMSGNAVAVAAAWDHMLVRLEADIIALCGHGTMARHYATSGARLLDAGHRRLAFLAYRKSVAHGWSAAAARGMILLLLPRWCQRYLLPAAPTWKITRTVPRVVSTPGDQALAHPEFSVIIPTFNRAHVLPRAIDSVLAQSCADFELLVIDDGSLDRTERCVAGYQDARIRYIRHESNRGQNAALNTGLDAARGTFVSFLDSDDAWDPGMLDTARERFHSDDTLGWVYTAYRVRETTGEVRSPLGSTLEGWVFPEALEEGAVSPSSMMSVRRACFDVAGGFDLDDVVGQDDVMCLKLARSFRVGRVNAVLATMHCDGGERVSQNQALAADGYYRLHRKFRSDIVALQGRARMAQHYLHAGRLFLDAGKRRMAFLAHFRGLTMGSPSAILRMGFSLLPRGWQQGIWNMRHPQ